VTISRAHHFFGQYCTGSVSTNSSLPG
jgi:hypothetical protein